MEKSTSQENERIKENMFKEWCSTLTALEVKENDKRTMHFIWLNCPLIILNKTLEISRENFIKIIKKALHKR